MNINIQSNYQYQNFGMVNDIRRVLSLIGASAVTAVFTEKNSDAEGMSSGELAARVDVARGKKTKQNVFNAFVAYEYFAKGKLKNVPEYHTAAQKEYNTPSLDRDRFGANKLNTLVYQERVVDTIIGNEVLIGNKYIREGLFDTLHFGYEWFVSNTDQDNEKWLDDFDKKSNAQVKILKAYAANEEMQKNEHINKMIIKFMGSIYSIHKNYDETADFIIDILSKNTDNNDEKFFTNLYDLLIVSTEPKLITKIQSDKRLYDNLNDAVISQIHGNDSNEELVNNIKSVLDNYTENYADSEPVTKNLKNILYDAFDYPVHKNPVEFTDKIMKILSSKEVETASELGSRINTQIDDIIHGKYDDKSNSDEQISKNRLDMLRDLRTEIKYRIIKYNSIENADKEIKKTLGWCLGTVIARIDELKTARERMNIRVEYSDRMDGIYSQRIFAMLD